MTLAADVIGTAAALYTPAAGKLLPSIEEVQGRRLDVASSPVGDRSHRVS